MRHDRVSCRVALAMLIIAGFLAAPQPGSPHPLGNFSISHYTAIRLEQHAIVLRYLLDVAEIPTFQEIQDTGIVPQRATLACRRTWPARLRCYKTA